MPKGKELAVDREQHNVSRKNLLAISPHKRIVRIITIENISEDSELKLAKLFGFIKERIDTLFSRENILHHQKQAFIELNNCFLSVVAIDSKFVLDDKISKLYFNRLMRSVAGAVFYWLVAADTSDQMLKMQMLYDFYYFSKDKNITYIDGDEFFKTKPDSCLQIDEIFLKVYSFINKISIEKINELADLSLISNSKMCREKMVAAISYQQTLIALQIGDIGATATGISSIQWPHVDRFLLVEKILLAEDSLKIELLRNQSVASFLWDFMRDYSKEWSVESQILLCELLKIYAPKSLGFKAHWRLIKLYIQQYKTYLALTLFNEEISTFQAETRFSLEELQTLFAYERINNPELFLQMFNDTLDSAPNKNFYDENQWTWVESTLVKFESQNDNSKYHHLIMVIRARQNALLGNMRAATQSYQENFNKYLDDFSIAEANEKTTYLAKVILMYEGLQAIFSSSCESNDDILVNASQKLIGAINSNLSIIKNLPEISCGGKIWSQLVKHEDIVEKLVQNYSSSKVHNSIILESVFQKLLQNTGNTILHEVHVEIIQGFILTKKLRTILFKLAANSNSFLDKYSMVIVGSRPLLAVFCEAFYGHKLLESDVVCQLTKHQLLQLRPSQIETYAFEIYKYVIVDNCWESFLLNLVASVSIFSEQYLQKRALLLGILRALIEFAPEKLLVLFSKIKDDEQLAFCEICATVKADNKIGAATLKFIAVISQFKNNSVIAINHFAEFKAEDLSFPLNLKISSAITEKLLEYGGSVIWEIIFAHPEAFSNFSLTNVLQNIRLNQLDLSIAAQKLINDVRVLNYLLSLDTVQANCLLIEIFSCYSKNTKFIIDVLYLFIENQVGSFSHNDWSYLLKMSKLVPMHLIELVSKLSGNKLIKVNEAIRTTHSLFTALLNSNAIIFETENSLNLLIFLLKDDYCLSVLEDEQLILLLRKVPNLCELVDHYAYLSTQKNKVTAFNRIISLILNDSELLTTTSESSALSHIVDIANENEIAEAIDGLFKNNHRVKMQKIFSSTVVRYKEQQNLFASFMANLQALNNLAAIFCNYMYLAKKPQFLPNRIAADFLFGLVGSSSLEGLFSGLNSHEYSMVIESAVYHCRIIIPNLIENLRKYARMEFFNKWNILRCLIIELLCQQDNYKYITFENYETLIDHAMILAQSFNSQNTQVIDLNAVYLDLLLTLKAFVIAQSNLGENTDTNSTQVIVAYYTRYILKKLILSEGSGHRQRGVNLAMVFSWENHPKSLDFRGLSGIVTDDLRRQNKSQDLVLFTGDLLDIMLYKVDTVPASLTEILIAHLSKAQFDSKKVQLIIKLFTLSPQLIKKLLSMKEKQSNNDAAILLYHLLENTLFHEGKKFVNAIDVDQQIKSIRNNVAEGLVKLIIEHNNKTLATHLIQLWSASKDKQSSWATLIQFVSLSELVVLKKDVMNTPAVLDYLKKNWTGCTTSWFGANKAAANDKITFLQQLIQTKVCCDNAGKFVLATFRSLVQKASVCGMSPEDFFKAIEKTDEAVSSAIADDIKNNLDFYLEQWKDRIKKADLLTLIYHNEWFRNYALKTLQPYDLREFKLLLALKLVQYPVFPTEVMRISNDVIFIANNPARFRLFAAVSQASSLLNMLQRVDKSAGENEDIQFDKIYKFISCYQQIAEISLADKVTNLASFIAQCQAHNSPLIQHWGNKLLAELIKSPHYLYHLVMQARHLDFGSIKADDWKIALYSVLHAKKDGILLLNLEQTLQLKSFLSTNINTDARKIEICNAFNNECTKRKRLNSFFGWFWSGVYSLDFLNVFASGDSIFRDDPKIFADKTKNQLSSEENSIIASPNQVNIAFLPEVTSLSEANDKKIENSTVSSYQLR